MNLFHLVRPLLRVLEAETARNLVLLGIKVARPFYRLFPNRRSDDPILQCEVIGRKFSNPVGLAAGLDKDAEVFDVLLRMGFGFVEVGTVTPEPQVGNPRPRLFRLVEDEGIINQMGFNSQGSQKVFERLARFRNRCREGAVIVGVNLGKNKEAEAVSDYVAGAEKFANYADYLVINVSSPNTPNLRDLQRKEELDRLLQAVQSTVRQRLPVLIKIAPDEISKNDVADICVVALRNSVSGIIISNTTTSRPDSLRSSMKSRPGGLSGKPLFKISTALLSEFYGHLQGRIPLIGVGGIFSGRDAYEKILAGASLLQLYSSFSYEGPKIISDIKSQLAQLLRQNGFMNVADAVGKGRECANAPRQEVGGLREGHLVVHPQAMAAE